MKIYLIGMGMGDGGTLTAEGSRAAAEAELLIGAPRMLEYAGDISRPRFVSYDPKEIKEYLRQSCEYSSAAVLLSGDTSFYSGAKRLASELKGHDVRILPGISSLSYMCALIGAAEEDTEPVSLHGRENSIICRVRDSLYTFVLLGRAEDAEHICRKLSDYGMEDSTVYIGSRLGYSDEQLIKTKPNEYSGDIKMPAVVMVENPDPKRISGMHVNDDEFIRGSVPMTKDEIRALSAAALNPAPGSVIYDIGAGTGSVSVELSLRSHDNIVYAIERDAEAVELIRANRKKFGADNIRIIEGEAPDVLDGLPAPDSVFIGGSGGNIRDIVEAVLKKNGAAVIVINTVTLDSAAAVIDSAEQLGLDMEASLVSTAHSRKAGKSLLMTGRNPVYIFKLRRIAYGK